MCGIAGIVGTKYRNAESILFDGIRHRGLDGSGEYRSENVYFAHRRLSIIDIDTKSNQPLISDCANYVLIFNGEIYNYIELRQKYLGDTAFRTQSDTEVLMKMLIRFGRDCLPLLNGMFAFAFYNVKTGDVLIARDRLGIKPLYISEGLDLVFSSEITPIIKLMRKTEIDEFSLKEFLKYQTNYNGRTLVKSIKMLGPGSYLVCNAKSKNRTEKTYWVKPSFEFAMPKLDFCYNFKEEFLRSVELRLRADVDYGIFLSGGIDSTAIVGAAAEVSSRKIKTLSIVPDNSRFDESEFSRYISKIYRTEHYELNVTAKGMKRMLLDSMDYLDYPSVDSFNNYIVTHKAKSIGLKMALSGLGGDELFAGYPAINRAYNLKRVSDTIPLSIKSILGKASQGVQPSNVKRVLYILSRHNISLETLVGVFRNVSKCDFDNSLRGDVQSLQINNLLRTDFTYYTEPILLRDVDQVSMRNGIEVRVPFLDHNIVELTWKHWSFNQSQEYPKQSLVDILNPLVPERVAARRKMGFTLPWSEWISSELKPIFIENIHSIYKAEILGSKEYNWLIKDINGGAKQWVDIMKWNQLSVWLSKNNLI